MPPLLIDTTFFELRKEITKDSLVNNISYFVIENNPGSQVELLRYESGAVYQLKQNKDNNEFTEWNIFDEYAQVNEEWLSDTINLQQFDEVKFIKTKVTEFHNIFETGGIQFENVTELETKIGRSLYEYPYGIGYCGTKTKYFAAGIGVIKSRFSACVPQGVSHSDSDSNLFNYNVQ